MLAPVSRYALREALAHESRTQSRVPGEGMPRLLKRVKALYEACQAPCYGELKAGVLIAGPDRLVNMILAYRAASEGQRVLLYAGEPDNWEGHRYLAQYRMFHQSAFTRLIEMHLGLEQLGETSEEVLLNLGLALDRMVDADGQAMIYQLDGCNLIGNSTAMAGTQSTFAVEPGTFRFSYPAIERMICWTPDEIQWRTPDHDVLARYTLVADQVWLTASPCRSLGGGWLMDRSELYADASRPMKNYVAFGGQDRLEDLAEALGLR